MKYDAIYNYSIAKKIVDIIGWEGFLKLLQYRYKSLDLFKVSKSWYQDPRFILKAKGINGDLVIGWLENIQV